MLGPRPRTRRAIAAAPRESSQVSARPRAWPLRSTHTVPSVCVEQHTATTRLRRPALAPRTSPALSVKNAPPPPRPPPPPPPPPRRAPPFPARKAHASTAPSSDTRAHLQPEVPRSTASTRRASAWPFGLSSNGGISVAPPHGAQSAMHEAVQPGTPPGRLRRTAGVAPLGVARSAAGVFHLFEAARGGG